MIVPGVGYFGNEGFDPGYKLGTVHEFDVVDSFVRNLCDCLELGRVRHQVLPVMTSPGIEKAERPKFLQPNQLVINVKLGWETRTKANLPNWSSVQYGSGASVRLAKIMTDALGQWGRCYVHGHQARNPSRNERNPLLNAVDTAGVQLIPYAINGRQALEYGRRLKPLAESLAWAIGEYLGDDACTGKPFTGLKQATPETLAVPAHSHTWTGLPEWVLKDPLD